MCNYTQHLKRYLFLHAHRKKGLDLIQKLWCECGINFGFKNKRQKNLLNQRDIFSSRRQYLFFFYQIQRIKFENVSREFKLYHTLLKGTLIIDDSDIYRSHKLALDLTRIFTNKSNWRLKFNWLAIRVSVDSALRHKPFIKCKQSFASMIHIVQNKNRLIIEAYRSQKTLLRKLKILRNPILVVLEIKIY